MKITIFSMIFFLTLSAGQIFAAPIRITPQNANILFYVNHDLGYTIGYFSDFSGTVELNEDQTQVASANIVVQTSSVNTHSPVRDEGLKSPLFLDAGKFPEASLQNGSLTIKGNTKPLALTVQGDKPKGKVVLRGSFDRNDFGMTYNKLLDKKTKSIGDIIELMIEIPLQ